MRYNEFVTEGFFDNVKSRLASRSARKDFEATIERAFKLTLPKWSYHLEQTKRNPAIANDPAALSNELVNWINNWLRDQSGTSITAPTVRSVTDMSTMHSYIKDRIAEYLSKRDSAKLTGSAQSATGSNTGAGSTGSSAKLAPGVTVTSDDPLIFNFRNKDYYINDTGDWIAYGSRTAVPSVWQKFFDKQEEIYVGQPHNRGAAPAAPASTPAAPAPAAPRARPAPAAPRARPAPAASASTPTPTPAAPAPAAPSVIPAVWRNNRRTRTTLESGVNHFLSEGGNVFKNSDGSPATQRINRTDVAPTVKWLERVTGAQLIKNMLGSTGINPTSGDLDLAVDPALKTTLLSKLTEWVNAQGLDARNFIRKTGISIHFKTPILGDADNGFVQTDFMFGDVDWMKFAMHGGEMNSKFKGLHRAILMSSIAKVYGLKWSPTLGLVSRTTDQVITRDPDQIAQYLLGADATGTDLMSVERILNKIRNQPNFQELIAQARETLAAEKLDLV